MKIAILGSAPSSVRLAPYNDPSWQIFGCSPGVYAVASRVDVWFELHRYEPGVIGRPETQKPWFSPEYCAWMAQQKLVWMYEKVPQIPNSQRFPYQDLVNKYGSYFFTSSIAWMLAAAIEDILTDRAENKFRQDETDHIGLWGVDMAANEEYADQRPGCQFFVQLAQSLGIQVHVPPESDLMASPLLYGIDESSHMVIKLTARRNEILSKLNNCRIHKENLAREEAFLSGALDDIDYMFKTWTARGESQGVKLKDIFEEPAPIYAVPKPIGETLSDLNASLLKQGEINLSPGEITWVDSGVMKDVVNTAEIIMDTGGKLHAI